MPRGFVSVCVCVVDREERTCGDARLMKCSAKPRILYMDLYTVMMGNFVFRDEGNCSVGFLGSREFH